MSDFKPKKNDLLTMVFSLYVVFVGFFLGITSNIIYDLLIKPASKEIKFLVVTSTLILIMGLVYIVNEFYVNRL